MLRYEDGHQLLSRVWRLRCSVIRLFRAGLENTIRANDSWLKARISDFQLHYLLYCQ
jgi:hypothetical protein